MRCRIAACFLVVLLLLSACGSTAVPNTPDPEEPEPALQEPATPLPPDENTVLIEVYTNHLEGVAYAQLTEEEARGFIAALQEAEQQNGWRGDMIPKCLASARFVWGSETYVFYEDAGYLLRHEGTEALELTEEGRKLLSSPVKKYVTGCVEDRNPAPEEDVSFAFDARYLRVLSQQEEAKEPQYRLICNRIDLDDLISGAVTWESDRETFLTTVEDYDDVWFETHQLLVVSLPYEPSGSIRHEVTGLTNHAAVISRLVPEMGTDDVAYWTVLISTEDPFNPFDDFHIELNTVGP